MAELLQSLSLFLDFLFQFPSGFDFGNHFRFGCGAFKSGLNEIPHQDFKVAKAKHFDNASAKVRVKESVFPEGVKGPVNGFNFLGTAAIINEAVRARLAKGFSGISATVKNKNDLFRRFAVHVVRAYFVGKHNVGLKNFAPLKIFQKKKKKKRKCSDRVEGKCDAIFFQKNFGAKF